MKRRGLLLLTGLTVSTSLSGCLGVSSPDGSPDESPELPESCDPALPDAELPNESSLNEDDIGGYIQRIERQRYLSQTNLPEFTTVQLSTQSVTPHDEGFVVDIYGWGWTEMGDNKVTVAIRETAPENVTVESADTAPFSSIERLEDTIGSAREKLADERCEGRVAAHLSQSEFETVQAAFTDMESNVDDFYYLQGDLCYIGVKFDEPTVIVNLFHDVPEGVSTEPVTAGQFDIPRLQEIIDQARSMSDSADVSVSRWFTDEEYRQLKREFDAMVADEEGFYYLQNNDSYAAVKLLREEGPIGDHAPWIVRYYVDDLQVRVTLGEFTDEEEVEYTFDEDSAAGKVLVC